MTAGGNILIIADMEGAAGIRSKKELDTAAGVRAMTMDIKSILSGIKGLYARAYIWDFEGDENNLRTDFGKKTAVISHPTLKKLLSLGIKKVFLCGCHGRAGLKNEFCPHTYSGHDVVSFYVNGRPVGESTLFEYLFAYYRIPVVYLSGSDQAVHELKGFDLGMQTVVTRRGRTVFPAKKVRQEMQDKVRAALIAHVNMLRFKKYKVDIVFTHEITRYFRNTAYTVTARNKVSAVSANFSRLYLDFVNGLFKAWNQPYRF